MRPLPQGPAPRITAPGVSPASGRPRPRSWRLNVLALLFLGQQMNAARFRQEAAPAGDSSRQHLPSQAADAAEKVLRNVPRSAVQSMQASF